MSTSTRQTVPDQNPVEVPLYALWDAAHYLRVSIWSVLTLTGRGRFPFDPEWVFLHFFRWNGKHPLILDNGRLLPDHPEYQVRVTFRDLVDLFVRAFALQGLAEWARGEALPRDRWLHLYETVWHTLGGRLQPAFLEQEAVEERVERLLAPFVQRLGEAEQGWLRKWLVLRLDRVELIEGVPTRLYPFSRDPAEHSPRMIVMDPRVRFGRPTVVEHGTPTDILFERHQAGDSVAELVEDYDLTAAEIEEALRYEAAPRDSLCPFFGW